MTYAHPDEKEKIEIERKVLMPTNEEIKEEIDEKAKKHLLPNQYINEYIEYAINRGRESEHNHVLKLMEEEKQKTEQDDNVQVGWNEAIRCVKNSVDFKVET